MHKVGIIGSGIAGLAAAIRLQLKGCETFVFESNTYPGGKLSEFTINGYRFDAGPSLFTMPDYVDELFLLADKNPKEYFEYTKLDEICRYFWQDGTKISLPAEKIALMNTINQNFGIEWKNVEKYLIESDRNYQILGSLFVDKSLHKLNTWVSKEAFKGYSNLLNLGLFKTLNQKNSNYFKNPKLVQLFNRYATYNGSDPYQTPASMSIIPHLEYNIGAFFPKNGMNGITNALYKLACETGVKFKFDEPVLEIITQNQKATGLRTKNKILPFDSIVSNMDISPTYRKLLPKAKAPEKILKQERSGSGLIFYWGVKKKFPQLGLHNIFFSDDYKAEFQAQFQEKNITNDPTIYLNITSKLKADDAPADCENWFILINAPANENQNWEEITARTRKNIIKKLSKILNENIEELIEAEELLDPQLIEIKTSSGQGALYGTSSNSPFAAFFRHPNFSKQFQNLYFVGGSVHPGGGIPLALSSAKIMANQFFQT